MKQAYGRKSKQVNATKQMIIIKGEIKIADVKSCRYNPATQKMDVEFNSGKVYHYACSSIEWIKEPQVFNPNSYRISR